MRGRNFCWISFLPPPFAHFRCDARDLLHRHSDKARLSRYCSRLRTSPGFRLLVDYCSVGRTSRDCHALATHGMGTGVASQDPGPVASLYLQRVHTVSLVMLNIAASGPPQLARSQ